MKKARVSSILVEFLDGLKVVEYHKVNYIVKPVLEAFEYASTEDWHLVQSEINRKLKLSRKDKLRDKIITVRTSKGKLIYTN